MTGIESGPSYSTVILESDEGLELQFKLIRAHLAFTLSIRPVHGVGAISKCPHLTTIHPHLTASGRGNPKIVPSPPYLPSDMRVAQLGSPSHHHLTLLGNCQIQGRDRVYSFSFSRTLHPLAPR